MPHNGIVITAVAPCIEDLIVSKLRRLDPKDEDFVEACVATKGLDIDIVRERIYMAPFHDPERVRALRYVDGLKSRKPRKPFQYEKVEAPDYPQGGTHKAIWAKDGLHVFIRELDERSGLYVKVDNPLGPAYKSKSDEAFFVHGKKMSEKMWEQHPDVIAFNQAAKPK